MNVGVLFLAAVLSAQLDTVTLMIGDQTDLHLSATLEANEQVIFPQYDKMLIEGIEIVDKTLVDTAKLKDGRVQLNQYLTITSFKDSLFYIPPVPFLVDGDTVFASEGLSLNVVQPFELDSTEVIADIKPIYKAPIWWWGIIRWVLLAIGLGLLGWLAYYLYNKYKRKSLGINTIEPVELRPADEVALEKLDIIKQEKIWQQGQNKEYHTQLTDVLREYIQRRFNIVTFERTSDEVLNDLRSNQRDEIEQPLFLKLKTLFQTSDLVKFAKWQTTPAENEGLLSDAYQFVKDTTIVTPEVEPNDEQKEEEEVL